MKRFAVVLAVAAVLVVGSASAVMAQTPTPPATPGQPGWGCGAWGGADGAYDPAANPTLKRLAEKMGIGAADLAKELQAGKSVAEVARARNVDTAALVDVLLAPMADMLELRQKYGYLTQEQADAMQKFMADQAKLQLEQKGFLGGFGMMGGGMMGGAGGFSGMMGPGMMGGAGGSGGMMGRGAGRGFAPGFRGSSY